MREDLDALVETRYTVFAKALRNARKEKKLSRKMLAEQIGVSVNSLHSYENAVWLPSYHSYMGLCRVLGPEFAIPTQTLIRRPYKTESEGKMSEEKAKPKKERDPELLVFSKNIKEALRLSDMDSSTLAACLSQPEALDLALNNIGFPTEKDMHIISNELHIPLKVLLAPDGVKPFGDILWKFRSKKNLTLRKLGEQLGIDHAILAKYEHRSLYPTRETYEKMIEIFGTSFEDQTTLLAEKLRKKETVTVQEPIQEPKSDHYHEENEVNSMIDGNTALVMGDDNDKDQDLMVFSENLKAAIKLSGVEPRAIRARLSRPEELDMALKGTGFLTNQDLQKISEELHVSLKVLMTPDGVKPFGDVLSQFRKTEKLSLRQLSELLDINGATISLYEHKKNYPSIEVYRKMCDIFGSTFVEQTTLLAKRLNEIEKKKAKKEKEKQEKQEKMEARKSASKEANKGKDSYSFGRILKFYRKQKGYTQAELTNLLGHYNAGIFERGNLPDEEIYRKMVDIFGLQFRKQTMWLFPELNNKTVKQPVTAPKKPELVVKDMAVEQTATTAGEHTAMVATVEPVPAETDDKQTAEDIPVVSVKKEEKMVTKNNDADTIVIKKSLVKALMLFTDDHDFRKAVQMLLGDGSGDVVVSVNDSAQLQLFKMLIDATSTK